MTSSSQMKPPFSAGQYTASVAATSTSAPNRLEPSWPSRRCRVFCVSPTAFVPAFCEFCMARHYSRATSNSQPKSAVSDHLTYGLFSCYSGDEPQSGALPSQAIEDGICRQQKDDPQVSTKRK